MTISLEYYTNILYEYTIYDERKYLMGDKNEMNVLCKILNKTPLVYRF